MKPQLSHKDIVKLGLHESSRGRSLNQIEADFHKMGIGREDAIKALKTVDYMKKREERKKSQENQAKSDKGDVIKNDNSAKEAAGKNKTSFLFVFLLLVFIVLVVLAAYLYFSGQLDLEMFNINFR